MMVCVLVLERSVVTGSAPRSTSRGAPSAVSLKLALTCYVSPPPTPEALNVPCRHGPAIPCQVTKSPAFETPAIDCCSGAAGTNGSQLLRHLEDSFFQLLKALLTGADVDLIHWFQICRSAEDQPEFPRFCYRLVVGLPGEEFQLECNLLWKGCCEVEAQFHISSISGEAW